MLCVIDEYSRECLAIRVEQRLNSRDVLDVLGELFVRHGAPEHIRSDNGPELIAIAPRKVNKISILNFTLQKLIL